MMRKQFDVYRNNSPITRNSIPFYLIVQHDFYADLSTRVIIPLVRNSRAPCWADSVVPRVNIEFEKLMLHAPMMTHLETTKIREKDFVCNLRAERNRIVNSIDALITNI